MNLKAYNMTYNRAKEFFLGEDRCELVLEDEAFWKKKNGNDKSPAEINFNILNHNIQLLLNMHQEVFVLIFMSRIQIEFTILKFRQLIKGILKKEPGITNL